MVTALLLTRNSWQLARTGLDRRIEPSAARSGGTDRESREMRVECWVLGCLKTHFFRRYWECRGTDNLRTRKKWRRRIHLDEACNAQNAARALCCHLTCTSQAKISPSRLTSSANWNRDLYPIMTPLQALSFGYLRSSAVRASVRLQSDKIGRCGTDEYLSTRDTGHFGEMWVEWMN